LKLLFLDIDGVVVTQRSHWLPTVYSGGEYKDSVDPVSAHCVRKIVEHTGCRIVINSSHGEKGEDHIRDLFITVDYDISEDLCYEPITKFPHGYSREEAILEHIQMLKRFYNEDISHWCVLDDSKLPNMMDYHVQVSSSDGIMTKDYKQVCLILGHPVRG